MMASFKTVLLLFVGLQTFALTSSAKSGETGIDQDVLKKTHSGAVCEECTEVLEFLEDLLSNKQIQEKIGDLLVHACADLPGSSTLSKICEKQVKMIPLVIKMVSTFLSPEQVCEKLKACDSSKTYQPLSYHARAPEANFIMCTVCETVINTVDSLLPRHRTENIVAEALKKVCHKLPFGMGRPCERMVDKYFRELIHLLLENASPRTICSAIHMCQLFEESFLEKCETCSPPFSRVHDDDTSWYGCGRIVVFFFSALCLFPLVLVIYQNSNRDWILGLGEVTNKIQQIWQKDDIVSGSEGQRDGHPTSTESN